MKTENILTREIDDNDVPPMPECNIPKDTEPSIIINNDSGYPLIIDDQVWNGNQWVITIKADKLYVFTEKYAQ